MNHGRLIKKLQEVRILKVLVLTFLLICQFFLSSKKNKKGAKANQGSAAECDGNKTVDSCCAPGNDQGNCGGGAINVNNMDLAKLKRAIDEMQSAKVPSSKSNFAVFSCTCFFSFRLQNRE